MLLGSTAVFAVSQFASGTAGAQDAIVPDGEDVTVLDTIYVSGENLVRRLQDTASSVQVFTEEDLEARPDEYSVQSVVQDVPNVYYPGTVGNAPIIRGQDSQGPATGAGAFYSGTTPRSTINVDGRYQSYYESVFGATSIWDVNTVEVFRGPQTTSQGANSIAGAIIVNTNDPTFTPEGALRAEYGSYNTTRVSGMMSGPIMDQLAGRATFDYYGRETFIDYINSNFDPGRTDDDIMSFNLRTKLLWVPENIPGLEAKLTYSMTQNNQPTSEAANVEPYDRLENNALSYPSYYQRVNTGIGDVSYEFENGIKLSNQIQYSDVYVQRTVNPNTRAEAVIDQQNFTNEFLVNFGNEDSMLSGVAGVYYAYTTSDESLNFPFNGSPEFDDRKDNIGVFTEVDYRFAERWTLTGALRLESDRVERTSRTTVAGPVPIVFDYEDTFTELLPKLALSYEAFDGVTVGAFVNRGFNPGGISVDFFDGEAVPFKAETSWNYEIFGRASLLEDKLFVSANLFYTQLKDAQRFFQLASAGPFPNLVTYNADEAKSYGVEFAMSYQVLDNLRFTANAGVLHTEIDKFDILPNVEGNEFGDAPGYSLGAGVEWGVLENLTLSANVQHFDGYYSDDFNTPAFAVDPYTIANARATYQIHDNLQIYGYVDNIFDERVPTNLEASRTVGGATEANMTAPRMFGLGLKATF